MRDENTEVEGVVLDKLDEALTATETGEKNFQIRQAQQLVVGLKDRDGSPPRDDP